MRIAEHYSHLNGLEHLLVHQPGLWDEVQSVIASVDAEVCRTKISKEIRKAKSGNLYSPIDLNAQFKSLLAKRGWSERRVHYWVTGDVKLIRQTINKEPDAQRTEITAAGRAPILSYNQTDFVKNRVAIEVQLGKYAFVAYDLFVKHLAFYVRDEIDVGIEILPTKAMQSLMSSGIAYYEGELYNVIRNGRGVPAVPLVLIGIQP
ncbi:MAG: restriction endonuclease [Verrucomicrobia bacterium]|nr:restriction endonuclease [Verrucomicrobiota bacterium]